MTINRIKAPYYIPTVASYYAYSSNSTAGQTISTFVANGDDNTVAGLTYRVHSFVGAVGTYQITFDTPGLVDVLVAAGGGGGGHGETSANTFGGGGGAGGLLRVYGYGVMAQTYSVIIGAGGAGSVGGSATRSGLKGGDSSFGNLVAFGGGAGSYGEENAQLRTGGSGGGTANAQSNYGGCVPNQGNLSGIRLGAAWPGCGGGGAGGPAENTTTTSNTGPGGFGGPGLNINFRGFAEGFCAGGGGGGGTAGASLGGTFGGGNGAVNMQNGMPGTSWGSGGGGAGKQDWTGGAGYQGCVMIRYPITL